MLHFDEQKVECCFRLDDGTDNGLLKGMKVNCWGRPLFYVSQEGPSITLASMTAFGIMADRPHGLSSHGASGFAMLASCFLPPKARCGGFGEPSGDRIPVDFQD
jgi:hypothetical protein